MVSTFSHVIALPPYALALFIVVVFILLFCITAWMLLARRHRFFLRIPTTQVEAQVQVQVQVEKVHDPPPARSSSWLGLPFALSSTPSPSDTWIQRILRSHSKEAATISYPDSPAVEKHTPAVLPLNIDQPPRPVKKELWLAFDSDATLATLQNDPLGQHCGKGTYRDPTSSRAAPSTPPLVHNKPASPSPVSFWEPFTPPLVPKDPTSASMSSLGSECIPKVAVKEDKDTDHDTLPAPKGIPISLPSASSSICTLIHDTLPLPSSSDILSPEYDMDSDADLKVSCTRLAALIDAISVSFSASTLGPPFSRRNTKLGLGSCHYDFGDDSDSDGDLPHCADDDEKGSHEWDIGTAKLHGAPVQRDYSVLAI